VIVKSQVRKTLWNRLGWKGLAVIGIVYLILPVDLIPDIIPLLGQLDDLGVIVGLISLAWRNRKR